MRALPPSVSHSDDHAGVFWHPGAAYWPLECASPDAVDQAKDDRCSEIDESSTHYRRHMRLGPGAGSASAVEIHGKQDQGDASEGRDAGEGGSRDPAGQPAVSGR